MSNPAPSPSARSLPSPLPSPVRQDLRRREGTNGHTLRIGPGVVTDPPSAVCSEGCAS